MSPYRGWEWRFWDLAKARDRLERAACQQAVGTQLRASNSALGADAIGLERTDVGQRPCQSGDRRSVNRAFAERDACLDRSGTGSPPRL
jgi:hypothetical protein